MINFQQPFLFLEFVCTLSCTKVSRILRLSFRRASASRLSFSLVYTPVGPFIHSHAVVFSFFSTFSPFHREGLTIACDIPPSHGDCWKPVLSEQPSNIYLVSSSLTELACGRGCDGTFCCFKLPGHADLAKRSSGSYTGIYLGPTRMSG